MPYLPAWYCKLVKELTSQQKCKDGPVLVEFTSFMFPNILKQFDRTVEWPFEDSVTVPARWQYLAGLEQGSPEV